MTTKAPARFQAVMRPATLREEDGTLCAFGGGIVDTETNMIVYVASREASRRFARTLETDERAREIVYDKDKRDGPYPVHAVFATVDEAFAAVNAHDAGSCYCGPDGEPV
jgi:hypothetical protein